MAKSHLLVALIVVLAFSLPIAAKTYKWVDDKGTTHYSETIPPEYANKDRTELDKSGRVIKKEVVLTPEQRRASEVADTDKRNDDGAALELKRRDKALNDTYSSVEEIDLARNRNLQQVQTRISSVSSQIKIATDNLLALKKEAALLSSAGKIIPPSLKEDILDSQARLAKLQQELEKTQAEKTAVEARYDADKARYRELTGK
jgi:hypothetical protein